MNKKNTLLIGVDEAGRGAVIGPLSITSVVMTQEQEEYLKEVIKYDSKRYKRRARERLLEEIISNHKIISYYNILIQPSTINDLMGRGISLNIIEISHMVEAIEKCLEKISMEEEHLKIYIDSMYNDPLRCKFNIIYKLQERLNKKWKFNVICEHKADEKYIPVRVASIISKVLRDKEIEELHKIYGDFGSGYPSDPKTKSFLNKLAMRLDNNKIYSIVRIYWKTWKNMVNKDVEEDKFL